MADFGGITRVRSRRKSTPFVQWPQSFKSCLLSPRLSVLRSVEHAPQNTRRISRGSRITRVAERCRARQTVRLPCPHICPAHPHRTVVAALSTIDSLYRAEFSVLLVQAILSRRGVALLAFLLLAVFGRDRDNAIFNCGLKLSIDRQNALAAVQVSWVHHSNMNQQGDARLICNSLLLKQPIQFSNCRLVDRRRKIATCNDAAFGTALRKCGLDDERQPATLGLNLCRVGVTGLEPVTSSV